MKTNLFLSIAGLTFLMLMTSSRCKNESGSGSAVSDPLFLKCWANAFEEEGQDNIRIFRPCMTHTFPAARYRNTFTLKENGAVEYSVLAPNDAHTNAEGKWSYDPQTKKLVILDKENAVVSEYEVLELTEDLLRVKE